MKWVKSWSIPSSDGTKTYTVSLSDTGEYGCDCPVWKFKRKECKHIEVVKSVRVAESSLPDAPVDPAAHVEPDTAPPKSKSEISSLVNIMKNAIWRI